VRSTPDLPARFRRPYGPGWALVGDAGLVMDPITGQAISDGLCDAELLDDALASGGDCRAMARFHRRRDRAARPMYDLTRQLAGLPVQGPAERLLFPALAAAPDGPERFFGVLTGAYPPSAVFSAPALIRLLGPRGFLRLARSRG
jgi:2-polyprenyl-6-methoxyphenol hydroxylase-like FAD-dependent oxidoreductase